MNSTTTTTWPNQWVSRYVPGHIHTDTHASLYYAPRDMRMENADTSNRSNNDQQTIQTNMVEMGERL